MSDPLGTYQPADMDESAATKYYGFISRSGAWYIQEITETTAKYVKGVSAYSTNWVGRVGLTYDYYNEVFG
jgi:hypothetical protein